MAWLLSQPDHILNAKEAQKETLQADYTVLNKKIVIDPTHEEVIRRDLTRQLSSMITEIMEELGNGFDQYFGLDTENWKEIGVYQNMINIVARTSNRVLVGLPLCE